MNRCPTFAIALLMAWPAVARSQSLGEIFEHYSKVPYQQSPTGLGDLKAYSESLTGSHMGDWSAYNRAGWRALDRGSYDTAEHEFRSAIKSALREGLDDPRLVARSYADYAWALQKQGRNAEAEPLLKWALIVREAKIGRDSPSVFQTLNQLATLYSDLGRSADAEPLLRRVIAAQAKSSKTDPREESRSHTLMGLLLAGQRRYAESEPYFKRAVALRERTYGRSSPDTADALSNLAWTYLEQGKDDDAQPLFERALQIIELARGESDGSAAHTLDGLGQILAHQGRDDDAEQDYLRAISIWEKSAGEEFSLLQVLRHYAELLVTQGRNEELSRVKARISPLRARFSFSQEKIGRWYRFPDPFSGVTMPLRSPG